MRLWDSAKGEVVSDLPSHDAPVCCLRFAASGHRLGSASGPKSNSCDDRCTVHVVDTHDGRLLHTVRLDGSVRSLRFGDGDERLFVACSAGYVLSVDLETGDV